MAGRAKVLVVAQTPSLTDTIVESFDAAIYEITVARSFASGKVHLDLEPDLLVTELRLGEYNGLHLALRARARAIPAMVIGEPDSVLENEASKLAAQYVRTPDLQRDQLIAMASALLATRPATARQRLGWLHGAAGSSIRVAGNA
jgi:DNA-binding response OmpR family regulator